MEELLTVSGLSKTFHLSKKQQKLEKTTEKVKVAVDDLSFCTYRGEVFGLLGPNGAGKTTTLRMLATLIKPDKGDALIDGSSIVTDPNGVRKKIGFLTSELKLEEFFTPNYLFDFFSELYGIDPAERDERKRLLFQKFGVDEFAEVKVSNLSTGMKQKVSLIISLVHDPQIIIFDEPTKKSVYAQQTSAVKGTDKSNCPLCALGSDNNHGRIWKLSEMDADHVSAWSNGGATDISNCQMLCKTHNRAKGNR